MNDLCKKLQIFSSEVRTTLSFNNELEFVSFTVLNFRLSNQSQCNPWFHRLRALKSVLEAESWKTSSSSLLEVTISYADVMIKLLILNKVEYNNTVGLLCILIRCQLQDRQLHCKTSSQTLHVISQNIILRKLIMCHKMKVILYFVQ